MTKINLSESSKIIALLKQNFVIFTPTDTINGLLSLSDVPLYEIKKRDISKKIIRFISSYNKVPNLNHEQIAFIEKFSPGDLTFVKDKIAYRIPANTYLLEILEEFDFLYCTSANISNQAPVENYMEAYSNFKSYSQIAYVISEIEMSNNPSTIVDIDTWKIIRKGSNLEIEKAVLLKTANIKKQ